MTTTRNEREELKEPSASPGRKFAVEAPCSFDPGFQVEAPCYCDPGFMSEALANSDEHWIKA